MRENKKSRTPIQWGTRSLLLSVTAVAAVCAICVPYYQRQRLRSEYRASRRVVLRRVEALRFRPPANVTVEQWEKAVAQTLNVVSRVYRSPRRTGIRSLRTLSSQLDEATKAPVKLGTLRRIWDHCEQASDYGRGAVFWHRDTRGFSPGAINDDRLPQLWGISGSAHLSLGETAVTDKGMAHLSGLNFWTLGINGTGVGDEGLRHLGQCRALQSLDLSGTEVTDAGIAHIGALPSLKQLRLSDTRITGSGFKHLTDPDRLETLWLRRAPVEDDELRWLAKLKQLTLLDLGGTRVTGAGMEWVAQLPALRKLYLYDTCIDDEGLKHLARLPQLVWLDLSRTRIGDAGLSHLAGHPTISTLVLIELDISDSGLQQLEHTQNLQRVYVRRTRVRSVPRWMRDQGVQVVRVGSPHPHE